ncbi:MAG: hypothetical protein Hyperionvirus20_24 [Hyperionvirus sp.]|uniref:Uncharacterized protein n=1 Tax=Hyperionvirus sp. TaxID=2487770 RepID=A0A3G5AAH4_9VIRU|nr:MAG: hypothetical protein Hyperionvirus20_24 [Hyperionvirus sp.]
MDNYTKIFDKHKDTHDKFDSLFTIILFDYPATLAIEKVQHHLGLINLMSDKFKRGHLYNRLKEFKEYLTNRFVSGNITSIFLVGEETHPIDIIPQWRDVILQFDIEKFIFKHGRTFDLKYLQSLLTDATYRSVICVSGTKFTHYHYNMSKRKFIAQHPAKAIDLISYISDLPDTSLIHGTSNIIANVLTTAPDALSRHIIEKRQLKDTEIEDLFEIRTNSEKSKDLELWLSRILHPEYSKRLVFGKDIPRKISEKLIKTIFCSPEMSQKILQRVPPELHNFELIIIKTYGDDIGKKLQKDYSGILAITYY